jgi:hypothetical protein
LYERKGRAIIHIAMDSDSKMKIEKQVHKGGEMILSRAAEEKNGAMATEISSNRSAGSTKKSKVNKSIKRYPKTRPFSIINENMRKLYPYFQSV